MIIIVFANIRAVFFHVFNVPLNAIYEWFNTGVIYGWFNTGVIYRWFNTGVMYGWFNTGAIYEWFNTGIIYGWFNNGPTYGWLNTGAIYGWIYSVSYRVSLLLILKPNQHHFWDTATLNQKNYVGKTLK